MTNSQLAVKIYAVLEEKCEEFEKRGYDHWCIYLKKNNIQARDYDSAEDAAEELMEMANDGNDQILCYDPFSSVANNNGNFIGGFQFLMVPKKVAEKIAVLQHLP